MTYIEAIHQRDASIKTYEERHDSPDFTAEEHDAINSEYKEAMAEIERMCREHKLF